MAGKTKLEGIVCAAVSPVTPDGRTDAARLASHCARVLDEGCTHVSVFGTTGEGASFSTADKVEAILALVREGIPAERMIPGIMTPVLSEAAEMLAAVEAAGCRAALVLPPFFYSDASEAGILAFFEALIARSDSRQIDLVLYNIPRYSRIAYTPTLIAALLDRYGARIAGIKDSTGDLDNGLALVREFPQLAVFTGNDHVLPPLRLAGGAGMIGGMPNLFAADAVRIHAEPDAEQTASLRRAAEQRIDAVDGNGGLAALKVMLARRYGDAEWARQLPPLTPLSPAAEATVLAALAETGYVPENAA